MPRSQRAGAVEAASRRYLQYVLLPAWFVPGLLDWWMHRRTRIEATSGTAESVLHSVMMGEAGLAVLVGLLCDINAGALSLMAGAAVAHQATAVWDVSSTYGTREITPAEQHVHSALEMIPFMGLSFAAVLHPDQVRPGPRKRPDWGLRLKREGLPSWRYLLGIGAAVAGFVVLPYGAEFRRCRRHRRRRATPPGGEAADERSLERPVSTEQVPITAVPAS